MLIGSSNCSLFCISWMLVRSLVVPACITSSTRRAPLKHTTWLHLISFVVRHIIRSKFCILNIIFSHICLPEFSSENVDVFIENMCMTSSQPMTLRTSNLPTQLVYFSLHILNSFWKKIIFTMYSHVYYSYTACNLPYFIYIYHIYQSCHLRSY
jgi:hypothetical protein